jgi:hypothetical protein
LRKQASEKRPFDFEATRVCFNGEVVAKIEDEDALHRTERN